MPEPSTEVFAEKKTTKPSVPTTTEYNNPELEPSSEYSIPVAELSARKKQTTKVSIPTTTDYSSIVPELFNESSDDEVEPQNVILSVNPAPKLMSELSAEVLEDEITTLSVSPPPEIAPEIPTESPEEELTGQCHKKILNKEEAKKHLQGIKTTKASG